MCENYETYISEKGLNFRDRICYLDKSSGIFMSKYL